MIGDKLRVKINLSMTEFPKTEPIKKETSEVSEAKRTNNTFNSAPLELKAQNSNQTIKMTS